MVSAEVASLRDTLLEYSRPGELSEEMDDGRLLCVACGHRCRIGPGKEGICKVRFNRDGVLYVPHGYVGGMQIDPIEKKPFFHALPGSNTLSFGMLGCDYHCSYCQNWFTSQAIRDPKATARPKAMTSGELVGIALRHRTPVITSTYNEPLITSEWAVEIFRLAREHGILCSYVSNGNGTTEVLEYIRPFVQLYKIDLKSFRQKNYQQLGGRLSAVLDTIATLRDMGIWLEVVTLVIEGFNDSDAELRDIAGFLASVSPDIPWHVTAFHQDYRMVEPENTSPSSLLRAASIGREQGLHYVYAGNLPGQLGSLENTTCPSCETTLIERTGFRVTATHLVDGACFRCSRPIPGIWSARTQAQPS